MIISWNRDKYERSQLTGGAPIDTDDDDDTAYKGATLLDCSPSSSKLTLQNASGKIITKCERVQKCDWRRSSEVTTTRHNLVHVMSPLAPKGPRGFGVKQRGLRV